MLLLMPDDFTEVYTHHITMNRGASSKSNKFGAPIDLICMILHDVYLTRRSLSQEEMESQGSDTAFP